MQRAAWWVSVATAAVVLLAGCGGDEEKPSDVPTSVSSSASPSLPSFDPQAALKAVILARYVQYHRTVEQVLSSNDTDSAALRDIARGAAFRSIVNTAIKSRARGEVAKGEVLLKPAVQSIAADHNSAIVVDCEDSSNFRIYDARTGKPKYPSQSFTPKRVLTTMERVQGRWMVSSERLVGTC